MENELMDTLIRYYFDQGLQQQEILLYLISYEESISQTTLKRRLKKMNLYRRKMYTTLDNVRTFLEGQLLSSGQMCGYKWMHRRCIQNGMIVKQSTVRHLMHVLDPEGIIIRRRNRLRRRQYFNKGPNYLWHIDGYDKLKPYGICIHGCIDGFSRKILWLNAAYSNNDPKIICNYFLETLIKLGGYPHCIRGDMGTENTLVQFVQQHLHEAANNTTHSMSSPFLYGSSHTNQRIEAWWAMLRRQNSQYWMNRFEQMKNDGLFNGSVIDKSILQYCFMDLIEEELRQFAEEWNSHVIRRVRSSISPSGRPNRIYDFPTLYGGRNFLHLMDNRLDEQLADECVVFRKPCKDERLLELCNIITKEKNLPSPDNVYLAINNYCELRREIINLLQ